MVDEFLESRQTRVPLAAAWSTSSSSSSSSQMALATTTSASAAQSHDFLVVAAHLRSVVDGIGPVNVFDGSLGSSVQDHVQGLQLAANGGPVNDRVSLIVQQIDFGSVVQQIPQHGSISSDDGQMERSVSFLVRLVD
jgi:hypothetical protein